MVHPKVQEAYDQAGYEYRKNSYDAVEERFRAWIGSNTVERSITHVTRVKVNRKEGNKEYYYFGQILTAQDSWKNNRELTNDTVGKYEFPYFRYEYSPTSQQTTPVEIDRTVTQYELDFKQDEILKLAVDFSQNVKFYVRSASKRYPVANFHDFIDGSFEELVELGRSGKISLAEIRTEEQNKEAEERFRAIDNKLTDLGVEVEQELKAIPNKGLDDRLAKLHNKERDSQTGQKIQPRN